MEMESKPVSLSYFVEQGVKRPAKAAAFFLLLLKDARARLGGKESDTALRGWLKSMVGSHVKPVVFRETRSRYHHEIRRNFIEIIESIRNEIKNSEKDTISVKISSKASVEVHEDDVEWNFFHEHAEDFLNGERCSLIHLAERRQLQTLAEIYLGFPIQATKYMYIRQTSDEKKVTFAVGLFQVHSYFRYSDQNPERFFSFLSSSSAKGEEYRDLYVEVGDIISSGSVITAITSYESSLIKNQNDLGSIINKGEFDRPIFGRVDEIRTFNFKVISSSCLRGVAFIKDGDLKTAVTPCVALPIESNIEVNLDEFRLAKTQEEVESTLEKYVSERYKVASRNAIKDYFKYKERIIING